MSWGTILGLSGNRKPTSEGLFLCSVWIINDLSAWLFLLHILLWLAGWPHSIMRKDQQTKNFWNFISQGLTLWTSASVQVTVPETHRSTRKRKQWTASTITVLPSSLAGMITANESFDISVNFTHYPPLYLLLLLITRNGFFFQRRLPLFSIRMSPLPL